MFYRLYQNMNNTRQFRANNGVIRFLKLILIKITQLYSDINIHTYIQTYYKKAASNIKK